MYVLLYVLMSLKYPAEVEMVNVSHTLSLFPPLSD